MSTLLTPLSLPGSSVAQTTQVISAQPSVNFTNLDTSSIYEIIMMNVLNSTTSDLFIRTSSDNGVSYDSASNTYRTQLLFGFGSGAGSSNTLTNIITLISAGAVTRGVGKILLFPSIGRVLVSSFGCVVGGSPFVSNLYAFRVTETFNAAQISVSTGTLSGTFAIQRIHI